MPVAGAARRELGSGALVRGDNKGKMGARLSTSTAPPPAAGASAAKASTTWMGRHIYACGMATAEGGSGKESDYAHMGLGTGRHSSISPAAPAERSGVPDLYDLSRFRELGGRACRR